VVGKSVGDVEGKGVGSHVSHDRDICLPVPETSHITDNMGGVVNHSSESLSYIAVVPSST